MDQINTLVDDITSVEWSIPVSIKLFILFGIMIFISVGYYMFKDNEIIAGWGDATTWLYIIIIINLVNITGVLIYNSYKKVPVGRPGIRGKSGKKGNTGKYLSCSYCKTNLYIDTVRKYDIITRLNIAQNTNTQQMINDVTYFNNLIKQNDAIDISGLVTSLADLSMEVVAISHLTSVVGKGNGTFMGQISRPYGKVGFLPLGDGITGGDEEGLELNYFMINGDIVYPATFTKLVQFPVSTNDEGLTEIVSLYHPEPVALSNNGKPVTYYSLGDISMYSSNKLPDLNSVALVSENCLQDISSEQMELIFLYSGIARITNKTKTFVLPDEDVNTNMSSASNNSDGMFKLTSNTVETTTMFSVWRTPLNTFITNIPNSLENKSFAYNALNGRDEFLDENGYVTLDGKKFLTNRLSSIPVSTVMTAVFYLKNFMDRNRDELDYYINKNLDANPTIKSGYSTGMKLFDLMALIKNAKAVIGNYQPSSDGSAKVPPPIPPEVLRTYLKISKEQDFLPFKMLDAKTMLDMVDDLFPSGIETLISVDEEGDVEGGIRMTDAQRVFLNVVKMLFLPNLPIMEIKDECLGTFQRDKNKEDAIRVLENILTEYKRRMDKYKTDPEKACSNWEAVQSYSMQIFQRIGEYVGHIPDYQKKIEKMDLAEFTTSKIVKIKELYDELISYIDGRCY